MIQINYSDLPKSLVNKVDSLTNDSIPEGQSFFLEGDEVIAVGNNLRSLFELQNQSAIESGSIQEIV